MADNAKELYETPDVLVIELMPESATLVVPSAEDYNNIDLAMSP